MLSHEPEEGRSPRPKGPGSEVYAFVARQDLRGVAARLGLLSVPAEVVSLSPGHVEFISRGPCYAGQDTVLELAAPAAGFRRMTSIRITCAAPCAGGGFAAVGRFSEALSAEDLRRLLPPA